jgi:hypothetical protein
MSAKVVKTENGIQLNVTVGEALMIAATYGRLGGTGYDLYDQLSDVVENEIGPDRYRAGVSVTEQYEDARIHGDDILEAAGLA